MTEKKTRRVNLYYLASVALMTALVFVSNYIASPAFQISGGGETRFHVANGFCLLAGFLLGPLGGGFAAGVGSMLYDFTNPMFIASSPFTLVFKFAMGAVCGLIAYGGHADAKRTARNIVAALAGNLLYILLFMTQSYLSDRIVRGFTHTAALVDVAGMSVVSLINCAVAVVIAVPLAFAIRAALDRSNLNPRSRR